MMHHKLPSHAMANQRSYESSWQTFTLLEPSIHSLVNRGFAKRLQQLACNADSEMSGLQMSWNADKRQCAYLSDLPNGVGFGTRQ